MKPQDPGKALLNVKVTPNASKDELLGWSEGRLSVKIHGVPEKGQVNANLIAFLAKQLGIAKSRISIASGETSRLKRLQIEGLSLEELQQKLGG